jgi:hypothetical protein
MPLAADVDYERVLLELHREDLDDHRTSTFSNTKQRQFQKELSFSAATPVSGRGTDGSAAPVGEVWPPPSRGMMEDNSFLYERGGRHDADISSSATSALSFSSNHPRSHLVETPRQSASGVPLYQFQHATAPTASQVPPRHRTSLSSYQAPSAGTSSAHPSVFAALEQIEMLNLDKKQLKLTIQTLYKQLEHFHDVVGPDLDKFHTGQVKLREEVMRLREELRLTQQREHDAKGRCKDLELALMKLEQGGRGGSDGETSSPEARLAHLQDAIAKAYMQRSALLRERESVIAMRDAIEWRQKALEGLKSNDDDGVVTDASGGVGTSPLPPGVISDAGGSLSHWRIRGKEAELEKNLQQKETLIASLTAAAKEIEAVLDDSRSRSHQGKLSQLNARCPGCGKGQWNSPFCPTTGHPHAGFVSKGSNSDSDQFGDVPPPRKLTSAEVLASGAWRKVVEVETSLISYEDVASGRIVEDLEVELDAQHRNAIKAAKDVADKRMPPTLPPDAVIVGTPGAAPITKAQPGIDKEMRILLTTLHERNEEIQRLKALLQRMLDNGGLAALPHTQHPDAAPYPGAMPPLKELPQSSSLSVEAKMSLLEETNEHLNQRCAELSVVAQGREHKIALLTQEISRLRFGGSS